MIQNPRSGRLLQVALAFQIYTKFEVKTTIVITNCTRYKSQITSAFKNHAMGTLEQNSTILNLALDGGEWSVTSSGSFSPEKRAPFYPPSHSLEMITKTIFCPFQELKSGRPVCIERATEFIIFV